MTKRDVLRTKDDKEVVAITEQRDYNVISAFVAEKLVRKGYEAYLTYRMEYWDSPEFMEEVGNLEMDLEKFVLVKPVSLIVVDEDENGVHQRTLR